MSDTVTVLILDGPPINEQDPNSPRQGRPVQAEWYCVKTAIKDYAARRYETTTYTGHSCVPTNSHSRWGCHWAIPQGDTDE